MTIARLRLLATTDLHMHLLGYDYLRGAPSPDVGLMRLVPLIDAARNEGPPTLLFDNGDYLQGNALADRVKDHQPHPAIAAFNTLGYDAITIGNHEFDYGLPVLQSALAGAAMPVVCANVTTGPTTSLVPPFAVLHRDLTLPDGSSHPIAVGVIGFVPPQVTHWNAQDLRGAVQTQDMIAAARSHLPALRRAGADIIVALCHAGITDAPGADRSENAALQLAALPDIDVVIAGHTHDHFPGPVFRDTAGADITRATLAHKPAMMPGAYGDCLGQIDLTLTLVEDGWRITDHSTRLLRPTPDQPKTGTQQSLFADLARDHTAVLADLAQPLCTTPRRITSYLAAVGQDAAPPLVAAAIGRHIAPALDQAGVGELPLLVAIPSYRAGGYGGAANFVDIPQGPVQLRHVSAITPFDSRIVVLLRRGWQLRQWLDHASGRFQVITPGEQDQRLLNPAMPSYHADTLYGLRYRIDLSRPPRPRDSATGPTRVRDITHQGQPLRDDDVFAVATTGYRAFGGGGLPVAQPDDVLVESTVGLSAILRDDLTLHPPTADAPPWPWHFAPCPQTSVLFASHPDAADLLPPGGPITPASTAPDADGLLQFRLML